MRTGPDSPRAKTYGEDYTPTWVDSFGIWLSWLKIRRAFRASGSRPRLGDFGCGYHAALTRRALSSVGKAVAIDLRLSPELKNLPPILLVEGVLPSALAALESESLDFIVCNSVLEHLGEPQETLVQIRRLLDPGGHCWINVPSWRGKWFLEYTAFRLGLSPAGEMNDHKTYYDSRDLWPLLVKAGFRPDQIQCSRHKFGPNTFAVCRKPGTA